MHSDITFLWKLFQFPIIAVLPSVNQWEPIDFRPKWEVEAQGQAVCAKVADAKRGSSKEGAILHFAANERNKPKIAEAIRCGHRYPSRALASAYVREREDADTEDDILHIRRLHTFSDTLSQYDAELLLSFLTVPYIRLALVLHFFCEDGRVHALRAAEIRNLVESVVFEPGRTLEPRYATAPTRVPTDEPRELGTPFGALLQELAAAPRTVAGCARELLRQALELDAGATAGNAPIVLFAVRLACRVRSHVAFLVAKERGDHPSVVTPLRDLAVGETQRDELEDELRKLQYALVGHDPGRADAYVTTSGSSGGVSASMSTPAFAMSHRAGTSSGVSVSRAQSEAAAAADAVGSAGSALALLLRWLGELDVLVAEDTTTIDAHTARMCNVHAHLVLVYRDFETTTTTQWGNWSRCPTHAHRILASIMFLSARHTWNVRSSESGNADGTAQDVPETETFEAIHRLRRELVSWLDGARTRCGAAQCYALRQPTFCSALQACFHAVSERPTDGSSGARSTVFQWSFLQGREHRGRYVAASSAGSDGPSGTGLLPAPERSADGEFGFEVNLQLMEVVMKGNAPHALDPAIAMYPGLLRLLGEDGGAKNGRGTRTTPKTKQVVDVGRHEKRVSVYVLNEGLLIERWTGDERQALYDDGSDPFDREYCDEEIEEHERWVAQVFEPVRAKIIPLATPDGQQKIPVFWMMPTENLPLDAACVRLVAPHPQNGALWREAVVFRDLAIVHLYAVVEHGRQFYRRLIYTSDARYTLSETQPSTEDRKEGMWLKFERHEAMRDEFEQMASWSDLDRGYVWALGKDPPYGGSVVIFRALPEWRAAAAGAPDEVCKGDGTSSPSFRFVSRRCFSRPPGSFLTTSHHQPIGGEQLVPSGLLEGALPAALLNRFDIFQACGQRPLRYEQTGEGEPYGDAFRTLRGYARGSMTDVDGGASQPVLHIELVDIETCPSFGTQSLCARIHRLAPRDDFALRSFTADDIGVGGRDHVLVDTLYAASGSPERAALDALLRVEPLSHILAWRCVDETNGTDGVLFDLIELPRLRLNFRARRGPDGVLRLYSVDHSHLYVVPDIDALPAAAGVKSQLHGVPHALLLTSDTGELQMLVPNAKPVRPRIAGDPFAISLVIDRADAAWRARAANPYFIFPVHLSAKFVQCPSVGSCLYLAALRLLAREYAECHALLPGVASDVAHTAEEAQIFALFAEDWAQKDGHPDARAVILSLELALRDSPTLCPWDTESHFAKLTLLHRHVSARCRLTKGEELALTERIDDVKEIRKLLKPRLAELQAKRGSAALQLIVEHPDQWSPETTPKDKESARQFMASITALVHAQGVVTSPAELRYLSLLELNNTHPPPLFSTVVRSQRAWLKAREVAMATASTPKPFEAFLPERGCATAGEWVKAATCWPTADEMRAHLNAPKFVTRHKTGKPTPDVLLQLVGAVQSQQEGIRGEKTGYGFLLIYELLTGSTSVKLTASDRATKLQWQRTFATLLLRFYKDAHSSEPLVTLLSALSRALTPGDGVAVAFAPSNREAALVALANPPPEIRFRDNRKNRGASEFYGAPTKEEENAPLRELLVGGGTHEEGAAAQSSGSAGSRQPASFVSAAGGGGILGWLQRVAPSLKVVPRAEAARLYAGESRLVVPSAAPPPLRPALGSDAGVAVDPRSITASWIPDRPIIERLDQTEFVLRAAAFTCAPTDLGLPLRAALVDAAAQLGQLATQPLASFLADEYSGGVNLDTFVDHASTPEHEVRDADAENEAAPQPFHFERLQKHGMSQHPVALAMLDRLRTDVRRHWARTDYNRLHRPQLRCARVEEDRSKDHHKLARDFASIFGSEPEGDGEQRPENATAQEATGLPDSRFARAELRRLAALLEATRADDERFVGLAADEIESEANRLMELEEDEFQAKWRLLQNAKRVVPLWFNFIATSLLSSKMQEHWATLNPFLPHAMFETLSSTLALTMLRASRMRQASAALQSVRTLLRAIEGGSARAECLQIADGLTSTLVARRHFVMCSDTSSAATGSHESKAEASDGRTFTFRPAFLVFEFVMNILLRRRQFEMVESYMRVVREKGPVGREMRVKQMLMGQGKTTCISPLLCLLLADGERLVMQVMPAPLLEHSRGVLRGIFSSLMPKQITTFDFKRATQCQPNLLRKLRGSAKSSGIVVAAPSSIKSIMLRFIENRCKLLEGSAPSADAERELARETRLIGDAIDLWRNGCLIIDEVCNICQAKTLCYKAQSIFVIWLISSRRWSQVDVVLHPLKSELNFPIGDKHDLDLARKGERWALPLDLLELLFLAASGAAAVEQRSSTLGSERMAAARRLQLALVDGRALRTVQAEPHTILLDHDFYTREIKTAACDYLIPWMRERDVGTSIRRPVSVETLRRCLLQRPTGNSTEETLLREELNLLDAHSLHLVNLAHDWLNIYLPHCISKVDRVSFGILRQHEIEDLSSRDEQMPESRSKLAIPFVGLDTPSAASEFAHPDVVIGLTILAYRYEKLRKSDTHALLAHLQESLQREPGPFDERPSYLIFVKWVEIAGGRVLVSSFRGGAQKRRDQKSQRRRGSGNLSPTDGKVGADAAAEAAHDATVTRVPELQRLQLSNDVEMASVHRLLRELPDAITW